MAKYHKILAAVDGSAASFHSLREALAAFQTWFVAVSVAPPYEGDLRLVGVSNIQSLLREPCDTALGQAEEMATASVVPMKTICAIGEPAQRIADLAENENCDLIVMGAKGQGALERTLVGSVTRRVIGLSLRDVLVVPPETRIGWGKVLLATDGSSNSRPAEDRALEVCQAYGAELLICTVLKDPSRFFKTAADALEQLREEKERQVAAVKSRAEELGLTATAVVKEGIPFQAITDTARKERADLIVMGAYGRTGWQRLLMGSVTEKVIGHALCPVLVVKV